MTRRIRFEFKIDARHVIVDAQPEGEARYMVRMAEITNGRAPAFVRVGYLTGADRRWNAECIGRALLDSAHYSAKQVCEQLARWALTQPAFARRHSRPVAPATTPFNPPNTSRAIAAHPST